MQVVVKTRKLMVTMLMMAKITTFANKAIISEFASSPILGFGMLESTMLLA